MDVAPENPSTPPTQSFACRRCDRVVEGLARVEYSVGFEFHTDRVCSKCLSELFQCQGLGAFDFAECVCGVRVLEKVGEFDVAPA